MEANEIRIAEVLDDIDKLKDEKEEFVAAMRASYGYDDFMHDWKLRMEIKHADLESFRAGAREQRELFAEQEG